MVESMMVLQNPPALAVGSCQPIPANRFYKLIEDAPSRLSDIKLAVIFPLCPMYKL